MATYGGRGTGVRFSGATQSLPGIAFSSTAFPAFLLILPSVLGSLRVSLFVSFFAWDFPSVFLLAFSFSVFSFSTRRSGCDDPDVRDAMPLTVGIGISIRAEAFSVPKFIDVCSIWPTGVDFAAHEPCMPLPADGVSFETQGVELLKQGGMSGAELLLRLLPDDGIPGTNDMPRGFSSGLTASMGLDVTSDAGVVALVDVFERGELVVSSAVGDVGSSAILAAALFETDLRDPLLDVPRGFIFLAGVRFPAEIRPGRG